MDKTKMTRALYRPVMFAKRNSSAILSVLGSIGVIGTAVLAATGTPKALRLLEKAEKKKEETLKISEKIVIAAPAYIPAALTGVSTIGCILGANVFNQRKQAALASAYALLNSSYKEYREKVKELYGENADEKVRKKIIETRSNICSQTLGDEEILYCLDMWWYNDPHTQMLYKNTLENIIEAEYHLNRNLTLRGYCDVNEFYTFLGLDETKEGCEFGWTLYNDAGYAWIDFEHYKRYTEDGREYMVIAIPFEPTMDYL